MKTSILFLCTICCAGLFLFTGCFESYSCHLAEVKKIDSLQEVAKKLEGQLDAYRSALTFTSVPNDSISIMKYLEKYSTGPNRNLLISPVSSTDLSSIARSFATSNDLKVLPVIPIAGNDFKSWLNSSMEFDPIFASPTEPKCGCLIGPGPPPPPSWIIIPSLDAERLAGLFQGDPPIELSNSGAN